MYMRICANIWLGGTEGSTYIGGSCYGIDGLGAFPTHLPENSCCKATMNSLFFKQFVVIMGHHCSLSTKMSQATVIHFLSDDDDDDDDLVTLHL